MKAEIVDRTLKAIKKAFRVKNGAGGKLQKYDKNGRYKS